MKKIGIIGSGNIGGTAAKLFAKAGLWVHIFFKSSLLLTLYPL
jgi:predicted dinucleotide-binding enzyme